MQPEQRREHLLDAAARLLADGDVDSLTMTRLATEAGVAQGLSYAYFDSREELLRALFRRESDVVYERVYRQVLAHNTLEASIRAGLREVLDLVEERGYIVGALLRARHDHGLLPDETRARNRTFEAFFADFVSEVHGLPRKHAAIASAVLISGIDGLLDRWRRGDDPAVLEDVYLAIVMGTARELAASLPPQAGL